MANGISALARVPEHLDVFWVEGDGRVTSSWWHDGLPWSGKFSLGGFFPAGAHVASVSRMPNHLDLFVTGNDGRVYTSWWHEGHPWSGAADNWAPIGGFFPPGAPVTVISRTPDHLDLFVTGNDGRVYTSWWHEGHPWSGAADSWTPIGGFFPAGAPIAAVARFPNHLDLFITGNDGRVYTSWWHDGQAWSGAADNWAPIGGFFPPGAPLTALARVPDHLDVFVTGNDGRVYTSWWHEGHNWSGAADNWAAIGGFFPAGAPVAAVSRTPDHLDLFITGNDGRVYTSWWHEGHNWSGAADNWAPIGGFFPAGAPIAAVARFPNHLDLFITGNDGRVYSSWWHDGQPWSGVADNWFPITVPPGVRFRVERIVADDVQEDGFLSDGDEPYLVTVGFRSRFRTAGSTQVFWGRDLHELDDLDDAGDSVGVPASMGELFFPGIQIVSRDALMAGTFPEVFGAFVIAMESDATPFGEIRDQIDKLKDALHNELARLVEGGELVSNLLAAPDVIAGEVRANLATAVRNVIGALQVSVWEGLSIWLRSFTDPDDIIGFHAHVFAGVDDSLGQLLPAMSGSQLNVGPYRPQPIDVLIAGDGARYRVQGNISG